MPDDRVHRLGQEVGRRGFFEDGRVPELAEAWHVERAHAHGTNETKCARFGDGDAQVLRGVGAHPRLDDGVLCPKNIMESRVDHKDHKSQKNLNA